MQTSKLINPQIEFTCPLSPLQAAGYSFKLKIMIESLDAWDQAFEEIKGYGVCGLDVETVGPDPLISRIQLAQLTLPNGRIYVADILNLEEKVLDDLAALMEDDLIKKVIHNANFELYPAGFSAMLVRLLRSGAFQITKESLEEESS